MAAGRGAWRSELEIAAHREFCDWDYRIQDLRGMEVLGFLLQETQDCRMLGRLLQLQAHYEIMDGRPEDAIKTLRLGYQLAHDVAQPPLLINGLVGIAITAIMNQELQLLIDRGGPNMYWAIAALPQPLVSLRRAMEFEMGMPQQIFPFLKDAETTQRTPDEWRRLMIEGMVGLENLGGQSAAEVYRLASRTSRSRRRRQTLPRRQGRTHRRRHGPAARRGNARWPGCRDSHGPAPRNTSSRSSPSSTCCRMTKRSAVRRNYAIA